MTTPLEILEGEFFRHTRVVQHEERLEGQRVDDHGVVYVGSRAGPEVDISNLCHELGHFAEINDARVDAPGWGLKTPQVWCYDRMVCEPETLQITEREIRVMAYQVNLMEFLGVEVDIMETVACLRHLPDHIYVPLEDGSQAYGTRRRRKLDYNDVNLSKQRWTASYVRDLLKVNTMDRFFHEWRRKVVILEQRSA